MGELQLSIEEIDREIMRVRRKMIRSRRLGYGHEFSKIHDAIARGDQPVNVEADLPFFLKQVYESNLMSMQRYATDNQQSMISRIPEHASHLGMQAHPSNRDTSRRRRLPIDDDGIE